MPTEDAPAPFRIVLIAELLPRPEFALAHSAPTAPVPIDRETFDAVMERFSPSLSIDLSEDPHRRHPVEVTFPRLRAFRPEWLVQNVPALKTVAPSRPSPAVGSPAAGPPSGRAPGTKSLLDQLLDDLDDAPTPSVSRVPGPPPRSSGRVADVVGHPEVRRLEAAWRGVRLVTDSCVPGSPVVVEVLHATPDAVAGALDELSSRASQAGTPVGLVVVDAVLGATLRDRDLLLAWARGGEALRAPVVTNGTSEFLGFDTLEGLAHSSRALASSDDPRAALFRTVAADDASRWLVVALNGVLARPRHSEATAREGIVVREADELFLAPASGIAALVAASMRRTGAPFTHCGTSHGVLPNLPVRLSKVRGTERALSLEAAVSAEVAAEASKAGVAVFSAVLDRDSAVLPWAPVVFRGPTTESGTSRQATLTLGDQLFTAAAVNAVFELAQAIPPQTDTVAAREAALLLLTEALTFNGQRASCEVAVRTSPPALEVTIQPGRIEGVSLGDISFSAPLGGLPA